MALLRRIPIDETDATAEPTLLGGFGNINVASTADARCTPHAPGEKRRSRMERNPSVVEEYAQWMHSWAASEKTIHARVTLAKARIAAWGLDGFTPAHVQEFLGSNPAWSKWTRSTYHAHLKSFCEFLVAGGYLEESPMDDVRKARRPASAPRPLPEEDLARVIDAADGRTLDWILLALDEGLRAHEIAKLRGEHVSMTGLYVLGKGGKEATLPTHPDVWAMSSRYPRQGYWFPSPYGGHIKADTVSGIVSELFTSLGIEGSIHRVRHNYGTRLLRSGVNIRIVQKLMRHSSLETTALYTAVDEDELANAIRQLPSIA